MMEKISLDSLYLGQVVPINKPVDWSSFDVIRKLRYATQIKKIGHAGTLDPFATGLLLVCFSKATKKVESLMGLPKEYISTLQLGIETDSHDKTGTTTSQQIVVDVKKTKIIEVLKKYAGKIEQIPPMHSALRVKGKRLYQLAREGKKIQREPRKVEIYEMELLNFDESQNQVTIKTICSRGTYIRALARDIGRDLKCGAHLTALNRTKIGDYDLQNAWQIDEFVRMVTTQKSQNEYIQ